MKNFRYLILLSLVGFALSCEQEPEFVQLESGLKFRYVDQQEGNKPKVGDVMKVEMTHFLGDSLVYESGLGGIFLNPNAGIPPNLSEALNMCGSGDSVQIQMSLGEYGVLTRLPLSPDMDTTQMITWNIRVKEVDNESTILARMKEEQSQIDESLIKEFIVNNNYEAESTDEGVHYVILKKGNGQFPTAGNEVSVNYTVRRLDGVLVDTSSEELARANNQYSERRTYAPYTFTLGAQGTIQGWNIGIPKFSKGGGGRLLVPSEFAYGPRGRGAEVPPNTVLVFDIELVDFK